MLAEYLMAYFTLVLKMGLILTIDSAVSMCVCGTHCPLSSSNDKHRYSHSISAETAIVQSGRNSHSPDVPVRP